MANKVYEENVIRAIAQSIRNKGGSGTYRISDMPAAIMNLPSPTPETWYVVGYSSGSVLYSSSSSSDCLQWIYGHGYELRWFEGTVFAVYTP